MLTYCIEYLLQTSIDIYKMYVHNIKNAIFLLKIVNKIANKNRDKYNLSI